MLNHQTMEKLHALRLTGMADAYRKQMEDAEMAGLSFEERFGLVVDQHWTWRGPNTPSHNQLGVLHIFNRGGHAAADPGRLLGPCTAENGGNGKALVANTNYGTGDPRRSRCNINARDNLITSRWGNRIRLPHIHTKATSHE
jgi:hypothetical protein